MDEKLSPIHPGTIFRKTFFETLNKVVSGRGTPINLTSHVRRYGQYQGGLKIEI